MRNAVIAVRRFAPCNARTPEQEIARSPPGEDMRHVHLEGLSQARTAGLVIFRQPSVQESTTHSGGEALFLYGPSVNKSSRHDAREERLFQLETVRDCPRYPSRLAFSAAVSAPSRAELRRQTRPEEKSVTIAEKAEGRGSRSIPPTDKATSLRLLSTNQSHNVSV
jgi:hypothetical protein